MPTHFEAIGLPINTPHDLQEILGNVLLTAEKIEMGEHSYLHWTGKGGGELWMHAIAGQLSGVSPHFGADTAIPMRIESLIQRPQDNPLEGAVRGWAHQDGQDSHELIIDVPDFTRVVMAPPAEASVSIAGFVHGLDTWSDIDAFQDAVEDDPPPAFQAEGLTPDPEDPNPHTSVATLSGRVTHIEQRTEPLTSGTFQVLRVETPIGEITLVAAEGQIEGDPAVGSIVAGRAWLTGYVHVA